MRGFLKVAAIIAGLLILGITFLLIFGLVWAEVAMCGTA